MLYCFLVAAFEHFDFVVLVLLLALVVRLNYFVFLVLQLVDLPILLPDQQEQSKKQQEQARKDQEAAQKQAEEQQKKNEEVAKERQQQAKEQADKALSCSAAC